MQDGIRTSAGSCADGKRCLRADAGIFRLTLEKIGSPMTKLMLTAITLGFIGAHLAAPAQAQSANAEEVKICKETISEMTGGKPPAEAVKLCDQGKLNEAIEKAMAGG